MFVFVFVFVFVFLEMFENGDILFHQVADINHSADQGVDGERRVNIIVINIIVIIIGITDINIFSSSSSLSSR